MKLLLAALLLAPAAGADRAVPPLFLSEGEGKAPLTVKVQGPPALLRKAASCEFGFGGLGFWIDWGDNSSPEVDREHPDCAKLLAHTYTVAGEYLAKAQVSHPGPTDQEVVDWRGEARVKVGAGRAVKPVLRLLGKPGALHYGEGFPPIRVRAETSEKAELVGELVAGSRVLFTMRKEVGSSGEETVGFPDYGNGPPAESYSAGVARVRLRVRLLQEGRVVAKAESGAFELRASATFRELRLGRGKQPRSATAAVDAHHLDCFSAIVDWGDGTAPERSEGFAPRKQCPLRMGPFELKHRYANPGVYRVRWNDNDGDPFHEAEAGPGYLEREIEIGN